MPSRAYWPIEDLGRVASQTCDAYREFSLDPKMLCRSQEPPLKPYTEKNRDLNGAGDER